jgi:hypothetical protein
MWLTLLWHVGTGLPWAWRTGPSDSSERGHLEEMLARLPQNSLIIADAGFVGYDFWKTILNARHHFVVRVGANVRLIRESGYARQHDHTVYLWPDAAAKKKQPPLVLRLIVLQDGKHPVYLVTNLTKSQLSDRQAGTIYAARWGIELYFRTFKQTFGCRKLRSRSADNASLELDWSLLGLWCLCLLGQRELVENGEDPTWLSAAATIRAFQSTLREYRVRPESREESLWERLRIAMLDDYQRNSSKTSRDYPRKKNAAALVRRKSRVRPNNKSTLHRNLSSNNRDYGYRRRVAPVTWDLTGYEPEFHRIEWFSDAQSFSGEPRDESGRLVQTRAGWSDSDSDAPFRFARTGSQGLHCRY